MCAGAVHWSRVSRLVYSVSQTELQRLSGGSAKLGCDAIINVARCRIDGGMLRERGLDVFSGFTWVPQRERIANR
jgi:tRNA(Arg) A34 adenosine deaminase TadA